MKNKMMIVLGAVMLASVASAGITIPSEGMQLHLDASDLTTIDTNADGCVVAWRSKVGSMVFTNRLSYTYNKVTYDLKSPYYDATYADGKGGVAFGYAPDGTTATPTHLCALGTAATVKKGSAFIVFTHHTNYQSYPVLFGAENGNNNGWGFYSSANSRVQFFRNTNYYTQMRQNGVLVYDEDTHLGFCYTSNLNPIADIAMGQMYVVETDFLSDIVNPCMGMARFNTIGDSNPFYLKGWVAEVIAYDRVLSATDRSLVEMVLMAKWQGMDTSVWNGGASGAWNDAANWDPVGVPAAGVTVVVPSAAAISVSGEVSVERMLVTQPGSLTVQPGGCFKVIQTFTVPASGFSISATDSTLEFPSEFNIADLDSLSLSGNVTISIPYGLTLYLPSGTAVNGKLTKSGTGTLLCSIAHALDGADLQLQGGLFDLAGASQTFRSVNGY